MSGAPENKLFDHDLYANDPPTFEPPVWPVGLEAIWGNVVPMPECLAPDQCSELHHLERQVYALAKSLKKRSLQKPQYMLEELTNIVLSMCLGPLRNDKLPTRDLHQVHLIVRHHDMSKEAGTLPHVRDIRS